MWKWLDLTHWDFPKIGHSWHLVVKYWIRCKIEQNFGGQKYVYLKETNDLISEVSFESPSSGDKMNLLSYPFIPGSRQFDPQSIRSLWLMWKLGDSSDGSEIGCLGKIETQVWGMFLHERFLGPWFHLHRGSPESILHFDENRIFSSHCQKEFWMKPFPLCMHSVNVFFRKQSSVREISSLFPLKI